MSTNGHASGNTLARVTYKPVGAIAGAAGGVIAGSIFKRLWKAFSGQAKPPKATRAGDSWGEVLVAAAVQGLIFALVKAAVDRAGALAFQKATGAWPGDEPPPRKVPAEAAAAR